MLTSVNDTAASINNIVNNNSIRDSYNHVNSRRITRDNNPEMTVDPFNTLIASGRNITLVDAIVINARTLYSSQVPEFDSSNNTNSTQNTLIQEQTRRLWGRRNLNKVNVAEILEEALELGDKYL